eukprot:CAMPEP_0174720850 /NCGR_PEP_ID=MMETSP1094-20130205/34684_1 /TAXON_ID=156173 /ORGANISM="Chrysochromulina brevifilum, Strain UTEX LB 985" /LENGTH=40 /DNA_ID= /DNA_START= /DNA_END= /DNA_ORIENTATION=
MPMNARMAHVAAQRHTCMPQKHVIDMHVTSTEVLAVAPCG